MVTLKNISEKTGFSVSTISRLLNNDLTLSVTEDTKNIILTAALDLGYPKEKIKLSIYDISVYYWVTDIEEVHDTYFRELRLHLNENSEKHNMKLHYISKNEGIKKSIKGADSFIAIGSFSKEEVTYLNKKYSYGVFLESNVLSEKFDTVNPDLDWITKNAINLMLSAGHKNIGLICGGYFEPDSNMKILDRRESAFRQYLSTFGLLKEENIYTGGKFSVETGHKLGQKIVENNTLKSLPTAFFVASDPIAVGVLQIFNENKIHVPSNTNLISINDINIAKYISPSLSTYHIDRFALANTAILLLKDQRENPRPFNKTVYVGANFIERESFKPRK